MRPSPEELKDYAGGYDLAPVYCVVPAGSLTPMELLRRLRVRSEEIFVLEHTHAADNGGVDWDRYSFLCFASSLHVYCESHGGETYLTKKSADACVTRACADPAGALRDILLSHRAPKVPGLPPFTGGLAGYFSFEYIRVTEPSCRMDENCPGSAHDFDLMLFDQVIVYDREQEQFWLICQVGLHDIPDGYRKAGERLDALRRILQEAPDGSGRESGIGKLRLLTDFVPIYPKHAYIDKVGRARELIRKGEVAQIVLTNGQRARAEGDLIRTYGHLRQTDPTRYMCYFSTGEAQAAIASPEPIACLTDGTVMTERLAGTCRRGRTPEEDEALAENLKAQTKTVDEHNMLVDDSRNEFGFISRIGSVKVDGYLHIVRCARVMHMGTTITGELKEGMGAIDVINAITPSGAVSGAPKIRSCEVIHELEGEFRGIYGASVGYIGFDGDADICAFIHSAYLRDGELVVRAGGGIVIDSDPEDEYEECMAKTEAMVHTIRQTAAEV